MGGVPRSSEQRTSYENFEARCPHCGEWSVFNRASDLKTLEPVAGLDVACLNQGCGQAFRILMDLCNPPYELLILDCHDLYKNKRYVQCVLSLAQAFEVFYANYLQATLVERFIGPGNYVRVNDLSTRLYAATRTWAAARMRHVFLRRVTMHPGPVSVSDATKVIDALKGIRTSPDDATLLKVLTPEVGELLVRMKHCEVDDLRNQVVHKDAYRPTRDEVDAAIATTREIIFPLALHLGMWGGRLGVRSPA